MAIIRVVEMHHIPEKAKREALKQVVGKMA